MAGESDLHRTLKKEACRWLFRNGYQCVAAEVRVRPLGIIDAVGTGILPQESSHHPARRRVHHATFIECKVSRGDFLRDQSNGGQLSLCMSERRANAPRGANRRRSNLRQNLGLGKFLTCLMQPVANLHYLLAPAGLLKKRDVPPRWGLLSYGSGGISVVVTPVWQETGLGAYLEQCIARSLTADIFRADERAIASVNRDLLRSQQEFARRLRESGRIEPSPDPPELTS